MSDLKDFVKVHLTCPGKGYGEWPWVRRVRQNGDELIGRLDNYPIFTPDHGYDIDDIIRFKWIDGVWEAQEKVHGLRVHQGGANPS